MINLHIIRGLLAGLLLSVQTAVIAEPATSGSDTTTKDWQTWAAYRPGLYFGVRPNIPETLLMGLMWANGTDKDSLASTLRDTCQQDDGVTNFGWTVYDPRVGGSQTIRDKNLGVDLTTEFVKNDDGSGWAVRISGIVRPDAPVDVVKTTLIFHLALEATIGSSTKSLLCERLDGGSGHTNGVVCHGKDPALGPFDLRINADPKDHIIAGSTIRSRRVAEDRLWEAKSVFIRHHSKSTKDEAGPGNLHFIRFDFEGPFSTTLSFHDEGGLHISPDAIVGRLEDLGPSFSAQVHDAFPNAFPFRDTRYAAFAKTLLSNLLGGLGFFHGDSKVAELPEDSGMNVEALVTHREALADIKIMTTKPSSLLAFTPSRSFFPRGFLWDEGFHLLPLIEWDIDLVISVLKSWLGQMNEDGWIAREQILGAEARSRVPDEFQAQHPDHANPPTFIALVLPALLAKLTSKTPYHGYRSKYITSYTERTVLLRELYPYLAQYYGHFRSTQAGDFSATYQRPDGAIGGEGYRWRGRTLQHTLASGLDDYPRADSLSPSELHVDALAWVAASAKALLELTEYLTLEDDASVYRGHFHDAQHNLDVLHWSDRQSAYCDAIGVEKYQHICHVGYVSLMPLFLGLVNSTHPRLPALLATVANPDTIWSPQGLRSLSAQDALYGKGEDYWRGAVWINLNTLAVLRLREIGLEGETRTLRLALKLAENLRERLVGTVHDSWTKTGYVWEQYDDKTGHGRRSKGFTGWTAMVLLLMGLDFGRHSTNDATSSENPSPVVDDDMKMPEQLVSTKTVVVCAMLTLLAMLLRRRVSRLAGRLTATWRMRERRAATNGHARPGGRLEEVINLDDRIE